MSTRMPLQCAERLHQSNAEPNRICEWGNCELRAKSAPKPAPAAATISPLRAELSLSACRVAVASRKSRSRRDGRAVDCTGLENRQPERARGFESHSLRHFPM